jgi:hypothetical protein
MSFLIDKHKEFIAEMIRHRVSFILIGGYAVIFHGYVRTTGDLDIWLEPSEENKSRFVNLLMELGYSRESIDAVREADFSRILAFHIGSPPDRIDFLTHISGVKFEDAVKDQSYITDGNLRIPVISYKHLITNKMLSNRLKDKADVEELSKISRDTL